MATVTNLSPVNVGVGYTVEVTCQGFNGDAELTIIVGTTPATIVGQSAAGPLGSLTAHFVVPQVALGLRKVTVTDKPQNLTGLPLPTLGIFHTVVSDTYLNVNRAPLGIDTPPPPGSTTSTGLPIPVVPGVQPIPGNGTFDPNPTTTVTASLTESPGATRAIEGYNQMRDIVKVALPATGALFEDMAASSLAEGAGIGFIALGTETAVSLADFPFVAAAAVALLGEYGFGWLLIGVSKLFPNPSIFGWHPLGFLVRGIYNMGHGLESTSWAVGNRIANILYWPIRQIIDMFQRSLNATAAAHNKVAHVVTTTIPTATATAVHDSRIYTDTKFATAITTQDDYVDKKFATAESDIQKLGVKVGDNVTAANDQAASTLVSGLGTDPLVHQLVGVASVAMIPTAVALIAKEVTKVTTKVDQCMVDRCNVNSPHGLKTELLALLALLTDAGELAFLAAAITDPAGTTALVEPVLEGAYSAGYDTLNALLSL